MAWNEFYGDHSVESIVLLRIPFADISVGKLPILLVIQDKCEQYNYCTRISMTA